MSNPSSGLITLDSDARESSLQGRRILSLRRNLEASGIRATAARAETARPDDLEQKSDLSTLNTLAITCLTSGAAVALINALRATFEAAHSATLKATVTFGDRTMDICGENLNGGEAQKLQETLDGWIGGRGKGASA